MEAMDRNKKLELFFSKENMPNVKPWINIK